MVGAVFDVRPPEGFSPELGLLAATLEAGTLEWQEELGPVAEDLLTQRSFPNGPSIGALLLHLAESEAWWIEEIVAGGKRSAEFLLRVKAETSNASQGVWTDAPRMPFGEYLELLEEVRRRTVDLLKDEVADRVIPIPTHLQEMAPGRTGFTVRWIVAHVAQHEAYHGGQAVMIKRMLTGGTW